MGLRGGEEVDLELMEIYEEEEIEVAELNREQWQVIKTKKLRAEFLSVAAKYSQSVLWQWLFENGVPKVVRWSVDTLEPVPKHQGYGQLIDSS